VRKRAGRESGDQTLVAGRGAGWPIPRLAPIIGLLSAAVLAGACSGSTDDLPPVIASEDTEATQPTTTPTTLELDQAAVADLWEQALTVFEAEEADRAARAAGLEGLLPVDRAVELAEVYFVSGEPVDLTSNAVYAERSGDQISITDCTDSSGPTLLGATTAGFEAVAELSADGAVVITELDVAGNCVQQAVGQEALDQYQLYLDAVTAFWSDPSVDNPAIDRYRTAPAATEFRDYVTQLESLDLLQDTVVNSDAVRRSVEIVGYQPGQITLRDCQHGDETVGTFNRDGERVDEFGPPWRAELIVRMVDVDGEWLFDELVSRVEGDCQMGTSAQGLQLL